VGNPSTTFTNSLGYYYISETGGYGTIGGPTAAYWAAYFEGRIAVRYEINLMSDRREKTNIKPLESALDSICKLNIVTYNFIDDKINNNIQTEYGVISQELDLIYPDMVQKKLVKFIPNILDKFEVRDQTETEFGIEIDGTTDDRFKFLTETEEHELEVIRVSNGLVYFKKWKNFAEPVCVYGKEHKDVQTVTKNSLFMAHIKATQELTKRVEALEARLEAAGI
jgi:hypothetical protein